MFKNLRELRKSRRETQEQLADAIGANRATYQTYESGRSEVPADLRKKLVKLGYDGPFITPGRPADAITREEFAEFRGEIRAEVRGLREVLEKLGEAVRAVSLRVP